MSNPFGSDQMAAGYASARPPVHPRVIARAFDALGLSRPAPLAVDVGCGAGISTHALRGFADRRVGLEPAAAMLARAERTAPGAAFVVGTAEALPLRSRSVPLMTAAGSLNYVALEPFFAEAARVLAPGGHLLVYDFEAGRSFRGSSALDEWFARFLARHPYPASERTPLDPGILAGLDSGFAVVCASTFEIPLVLSRAFYLEYVLTETNVAAAVRAGTGLEEVRAWCAATLDEVWQGPEQEVLFGGYFAWMAPRVS